MQEEGNRKQNLLLILPWLLDTHNNILIFVKFNTPSQKCNIYMLCKILSYIIDEHTKEHTKMAKVT